MLLRLVCMSANFYSTVALTICTELTGACLPGYTFELQFHTPEGMVLKMGESHHLYEEVRSPRRPEAERINLYLQLKGLWDNIPVRIASCPPPCDCSKRLTRLRYRRCQLAWNILGIVVASRTARWRRFFPRVEEPNALVWALVAASCANLARAS